MENSHNIVDLGIWNFQSGIWNLYFAKYQTSLGGMISVLFTGSDVFHFPDKNRGGTVATEQAGLSKLM